nr:MAG TPA: Positive regulator of sigma(E), RseC/MucC [Caudoviricetes sp.]
MKEFKTEEEYEEASSMLGGCALLIFPLAMFVASLAVGFIFGAGYGFLAFSCFLMFVCIWFIYLAKISMHKAKEAAGKERDDD